jgi:hypothetical protein
MANKAQKEAKFLQALLKQITKKAKLLRGTGSVTLTFKVTEKTMGCWCVCQTDDDGNEDCTCVGDDSCGDCC